MICKKCGKQIDDDSVFCSSCGAQQTEKLKSDGTTGNDNQIIVDEISKSEESSKIPLEIKNDNKSSKTFIVIAGTIILLLVIPVLGYFTYKSMESKDKIDVHSPINIDVIPLENTKKFDDYMGIGDTFRYKIIVKEGTNIIKYIETEEHSASVCYYISNDNNTLFYFLPENGRMTAYPIYRYDVKTDQIFKIGHANEFLGIIEKSGQEYLLIKSYYFNQNTCSPSTRCTLINKDGTTIQIVENQDLIIYKRSLKKISCN